MDDNAVYRALWESPACWNSPFQVLMFCGPTCKGLPQRCELPFADHWDWEFSSP
jgi:hypothetical protein